MVITTYDDVKASTNSFHSYNLFHVWSHCYGSFFQPKSPGLNSSPEQYCKLTKRDHFGHPQKYSTNERQEVLSAEQTYTFRTSHIKRVETTQSFTFFTNIHALSWKHFILIPIFLLVFVLCGLKPVNKRSLGAGIVETRSQFSLYYTGCTISARYEPCTRREVIKYN